jgi:DDB1- and CUL4-associated factor 4
MCIITLPKVRDLWASHLRGQQLVLGGQSRGLYLPDLDHSSSPDFLQTDADVFCVTQDEHLIYTGSRHGTIHRFDKRVGFRRKGQTLIEGRYGNQAASGSRSHMYRRTTALKLALTAESHSARMLESGLLISQINGDVCTRFHATFMSTDTHCSSSSLTCEGYHLPSQSPLYAT